MTETTSAFRPEIQQSCSNRDEHGNVTENVEELYPFCISKFKHDARNSCCIRGNKVRNGRNASVLVLQRVAISYANMGLSSKMAQCTNLTGKKREQRAGDHRCEQVNKQNSSQRKMKPELPLTNM